MQAIAHDGTKLWSTRLAVGGESGNETITPLLAGGVVVAAQDGMVTGLGDGDGRVRWTWRGGTSVYGMWRSGQTVVVLTDQVGDHARFTALQTSDGHERWHLAVAPNGILGNVVATLSGGLAWVRADGAVQYMRMSDGRVRWSHPGERSPALIELDGRVVFAASGAAKAYDQATGRLEWTAGGLPPEPLLTADAGLVLVSSRTSGGSSPTAVTALDPASGTQRWRYDNGNTAFVLTGQGNRILLVTGILAAGMTELDSATGQPIWRVNASVQSIDTAPLLLAGLIVNGEGGVPSSAKASLVARSLATGAQVWTVPLSGMLIGRAPLATDGSLLIAALPPPGQLNSFILRAYDSATGQVKWTVTVPSLVQAPVGVYAKEIVVQSADAGYACATAG